MRPLDVVENAARMARVRRTDERGDATMGLGLHVATRAAAPFPDAN